MDICWDCFNAPREVRPIIRTVEAIEVLTQVMGPVVERWGKALVVEDKLLSRGEPDPLRRCTFYTGRIPPRKFFRKTPLKASWADHPEGSDAK